MAQPKSGSTDRMQAANDKQNPVVKGTVFTHIEDNIKLYCTKRVCNRGNSMPPELKSAQAVKTFKSGYKKVTL
jgi:hypothetical protein